MRRELPGCPSLASATLAISAKRPAPQASSIPTATWSRRALLDAPDAGSRSIQPAHADISKAHFAADMLQHDVSARRIAPGRLLEPLRRHTLDICPRQIAFQNFHTVEPMLDA